MDDKDQEREDEGLLESWESQASSIGGVNYWNHILGEPLDKLKLEDIDINDIIAAAERRGERKAIEESVIQRRQLINQLSDLQEYSRHALRSNIDSKIQELIDEYEPDDY